jgi:hypothetical protein
VVVTITGPDLNTPGFLLSNDWIANMLRYREKADGKTYALVGRDAGAALVKSGVQVFKWHKARGSFLFPVDYKEGVLCWYEYKRSAHMESWSRRDIVKLSTNKLLANQTERALARGTVMFAVEVQPEEDG